MKPALEDLFASADRLLSQALERYEMPEKYRGKTRTDILPEQDGFRVFELQVNDAGAIRPTVLCRVVMNVLDGSGRVEISNILSARRQEVAAAV